MFVYRFLLPRKEGWCHIYLAPMPSVMQSSFLARLRREAEVIMEAVTSDVVAVGKNDTGGGDSEVAGSGPSSKVNEMKEKLVEGFMNCEHILS